MNFEANLRSVAGPCAYAKPGKASNGFSFKHLLLLAAIDQYFFFRRTIPKGRGVFRGRTLEHTPPPPLGCRRSPVTPVSDLDGSKAPEALSILEGADNQSTAISPSLGRRSEDAIDL